MTDAPALPAGPPGSTPVRHTVTLLFADLSRSTELAAAMEAEHYGALLAELRRAYNEHIHRLGGLVVRVQGDGLLAMFGHPHTREDDARRAVQAALALHAHVRGLKPALPPGFELQLHSGIHGGRVLIGEGDIERGRFELMGPVPNVAARLADAAGAGEVLVSQETLGPAARHFLTDARRLQVKGHAEPIAALLVRGEAGASAGSAHHGADATLPLVGRQAEQALLRQGLDTAAAGRCQVVTLTGPPGIGKTRLAQRLLDDAQARGFRVLRSHCDAGLGAAPMLPFAQVLQALGETLPGKVAQAVAAVRQAIATLLAQQPVLLFVDDWHWADTASHQVLLALRALADRPLLVLLTTRDAKRESGLDSADLTLALQPLPEADALALAAQRLPQVDPFVAAEVCRHAGGNPLFIGELCHSVARVGRQDALLPQTSEQTGLPGLNRLQGAAGWLAHLVGSRLQALPAEQAALLRAAAVIGNVVPTWLLQHLSGRAADDPQVQALAEQDFLYPGERPGTLRFKHGLTRDIVYDGVGLHPRQLLHLRVAAALQQRAAQPPADPSPTQGDGDALEALAYHFDAGGDPTLAAFYAEAAGDRALAASALDRARAQYRVALAALDRLGLDDDGRARRWVAIVQRLGMVSVYDPTRADLALVQRAMQLALARPDPALHARTRHWLSYVLYALGDAPAAVREGEQALAEARQAGDDPLAVQVGAMLGEAHAAAGQYPQALQRLDEAIEVKRRHRSGRRLNVGLAFSLVCRACVLGDRGHFAQAAEGFEDALACMVEGEDHEIGATIHGWRAAVLLWQGRWDDAAAAAAESARIARATRSLAQYSIARAIEGYAHWAPGGQAQHLLAIEEATAWLAPRETGLYRSLNHGWLTEGLLAAGRTGDARPHALQALQRARRSDRLGLAMSQRALALQATREGRHARAARHLALADDAARRRDAAHEQAANRLCEARLALAAGHEGRARDMALRAAERFDSLAMAWHRQQALALLQGQVPPGALLRPGALVLRPAVAAG